MRPHRLACAFLQRGGMRSSFTLPELLIVVLIAGILATVGLPAITGAFADMNLRAAAQRLTADLNYIRNLAITEGGEYGFEFTAAAYRAFRLTEDGLDREAVFHPLTHRKWAVDLSADKIKLAPDFAGGAELYYDATGAPNPPGAVILATDGLAITLTVEAFTGRVTATQ